VIAPSWINVYPSFFEGLDTVSWVRIRFTMPEVFSNASFNLKMKNDNQGDVALNGKFLATIRAYGERSFGVDSNEARWLQAGENVITMTLTDYGGPHNWVGYQYLIELNFDATEGADLIAASSAPSASPSAGPSATPSAWPSAGPSSAPSSSPSSSPSTEPSASPSTSPSGQPSTSPSSAPSFESISHEVCQNFAVHARTTITFDGVLTMVVGGDVSVSPGTATTGNPELETWEVVEESADFAASVLVAHKNAMEEASVPMEIEIGDLTFTPGTYRSDSAINFANGTVVTLDGENEANPTFLFQAGSTLVTAADARFILINGAKAESVLWALGTAATLGANSVVEGSILAGTAITFGTKSVLHGFALAQSAVTFESEGSIEVEHYQDYEDGTHTRYLRG
jgi:hypothetical protein